MANMIKYEISFRRLAFYLIRQMHPRIDLSGINFAGLKGQNVLDLDDGVATEAKMKVDDDDEIKDSTSPFFCN